MAETITQKPPIPAVQPEEEPKRLRLSKRSAARDDTPPQQPAADAPAMQQRASLPPTPPFIWKNFVAQTIVDRVDPITGAHTASTLGDDVAGRDHAANSARKLAIDPKDNKFANNPLGGTTPLDAFHNRLDAHYTEKSAEERRDSAQGVAATIRRMDANYDMLATQAIGNMARSLDSQSQAPGMNRDEKAKVVELLQSGKWKELLVNDPMSQTIDFDRSPTSQSLSNSQKDAILSIATQGTAMAERVVLSALYEQRDTPEIKAIEKFTATGNRHVAEENKIRFKDLMQIVNPTPEPVTARMAREHVRGDGSKKVLNTFDQIVGYKPHALPRTASPVLVVSGNLPAQAPMALASDQRTQNLNAAIASVTYSQSKIPLDRYQGDVVTHQSGTANPRHTAKLFATLKDDMQDRVIGRDMAADKSVDYTQYTGPIREMASDPGNPLRKDAAKVLDALENKSGMGTRVEDVAASVDKVMNKLSEAAKRQANSQRLPTQPPSRNAPAMGRLDKAAKKLAGILKSIDVNKSGSVSGREIKRADMNRDGILSAKEIALIDKEIGQKGMMASLGIDANVSIQDAAQKLSKFMKSESMASASGDITPSPGGNTPRSRRSV
jgi:hypothetical protein